MSYNKKINSLSCLKTLSQILKKPEFSLEKQAIKKIIH